ncbi:hypothetical protein [Nocardia rhamnosiphila]|uniref:Lipoprotein n=1 Tax=Nocardia rhamnosiphila TaxID=426716 RepID=A0ABV2WWG2_9NOCA
MSATSTGRRFLTAVALAAICACTAGAGASGAETPAAGIPLTNAVQTWDFELAAKYYAKVDCYFETLDRKQAEGPTQFEGTGKTDVDAIKNAKSKAQSAAERGWKVKHCHPKKVWKK